MRVLGWKLEYTRETIACYLDNREWVDDLWRKKNEMNGWMKSFVK